MTVLERIERRVGAHAGLSPPGWVLASRVQGRMRALGLERAGDYLSLLESEGGRGELDALTERLRVGETRFFRHKAHVGALRRVVAPDLAARRAGARQVRGWSAGCATGQEAYTLALLLLEAMPGQQVDVLGTDISDEALAIARAGVYPSEAAAPVPPGLRERLFAAGPREGKVSIAPAVAEKVRFERRNLLDPVFPRGLDVILCRNVLMYFDADARRKTALRLIESLAPGGYLFLGYAESLRGFEELEAVRTDDGVVYRRPPGENRNGRPETGNRQPETGNGPEIAGRRLPVAGLRSPVSLRITGTHDDDTQLAAELRAAIADGASVVVDLDPADYLSDSIAATLRRAKAAAEVAGIPFTLQATRPGPRRWLARHGLLP